MLSASPSLITGGSGGGLAFGVLAVERLMRTDAPHLSEQYLASTRLLCMGLLHPTQSLSGCASMRGLWSKTNIECRRIFTTQAAHFQELA